MLSLLKDKTPLRWGGWAMSVALVAALAGCSTDVEQEQDIERTSVEFNAETARVPLPNTLALDEEGTMPEPPGADEASAQGDFLSYLSTLHGWFPGTPLSIPLDGPIDEATLDTDDVLLFELGEEGATELDVANVSFDPESQQIIITPAQPLEMNASYGYVLTDDVEDAQGNDIIASQPLFFATMSERLYNSETGEVLNPVLADAVAAGQIPNEQVATLESVRQLMQPVVQAAEAQGVDREDIVAVTHWYTPRDTFTVFDPSTGQVPFPNEFVRTGEGGTVNLPLPEDADQLTSAVIQELNRRTGFSITADGWLPIQGGPLDPETVTEENIRLAWVDEGPTPYSEDRYDVEYSDELDVIVFSPETRPFVQNRLNAGIVTSNVTDENGWEIKPTPAFVFLRSLHPLFEDGESTVAQLSDAEAAQLEEARQSYQDLFLAALVLGYSDRTEIANAWAFQTDESTRYQQEMNAVARANTQDEDTLVVADPTTAEPNPTDFDAVGLIQRQAAYITQWFIDPQAEGGLADEPTTQPVPIVVAVPDAAECGDGPYPVVIAVHGHGGSSVGAANVFSDALAAEPHCLATVAPDLPLHGARTSDDAQSGELFLTANVIATKNNFLQAVADMAVLADIIAADGLENTLDADPATDFLDETQIGYTGISLGAIIGTNVLATVPEISVGALNVPGAKIVDVLLQGSYAEQILPQLPGDLEPGTFQFFQTFNFLQWIVEPGDPWTFAPHVQDDPLDQLIYDPASGEFSAGESIGENEVLIQMAEGDETIPNTTTELLAEAIGVSLEDTTFTGVGHGFIGGDSPEAECALQQIGVWLSSGFDSGAALGDSEENACGLGDE